MKDLYDIPEPAKDTIYQWVVENTDKASKILEGYKARTSDHWVADEIMVKVAGKWHYHWNVMDRRTRYLLASHLSRRWDKGEAVKVMQKALAAADRPPAKIATDGYAGYPYAIRKVFPGTKHIVSGGVDSFVNNNRSERLQGTIRDRDVTLRGMDSIETGQRLLDGWRTTYNHFREHESLKYKTPAEVAKVGAPLTEWADVVRSDVKVAQRKPNPRARKDPPSKSWITKKRIHRKRRDIEKRNKGTRPYAIQTGFFDKEMPESPAGIQASPSRAKAPQPVLPELGLRSKPRPRSIKPPVVTGPEKPLPRNMRRGGRCPKPIGHGRR